MTIQQDQAKRVSAKESLARFVRAGMAIGLGSGSTAEIFVALLGEAVRDGLDIRATATSKSTHALGIANKIPMFSLEDLAPLDLCVDGADEIDQNLTMIKGGGACHVREKIVAVQA
ncbi:MAG: ribose-5-phosphate isomerase A, partial [Pseudomonadota bacterium]